MNCTDADHIWINHCLATFDPSVKAPYGELTDHVLAIRGDRITAIAPRSEVNLDGFRGTIHDGNRLPDNIGKLITPGLIDCHTHMVYGGSRAEEWEMRLSGVPYTEIAKRGGGILSTVRATRALSEMELLDVCQSRPRALGLAGATCIEVKSGYGLTVSDELKILRVIQYWRQNYSPLDISPTLLAAHAVPPEYQGRADAYVDLIIKEMIPAVAEQKLAEAVDVFCESIAFSVPQCERIWAAAKEHGLAVKGHVEQLSNQRGAIAMSKYRPWSADHLEYLDDEGVEALAECGAVAVLLPGAYYFLREKQKPPIEKLRAAGVPMAVATDLNPGTSPFASLRLAMSFACVLYGLSPEEALAGATREAAKALGRGHLMGTLEVGKLANLVVWDLPHPAEIVCFQGIRKVSSIVYRGEIYDRPTS